MKAIKGSVHDYITLDPTAADLLDTDAAGVDDRDVIVDVPGRPAFTEAGSRIVVNGVPRRLEDASELVSGLRAAQRAGWRMGVYAPEGHVDDIAAATEAVIGVRAVAP